jgi:hypothetical protein
MLAATLPAALIVTALAVAATRLLPAAHGAGAPAWTHWWCSAAALHASSSGGAHSGGLLAFAAGLQPHWPHLLALVIAPATLVYLRRANARYKAERLAGQIDRGPDIMSGPPLNPSTACAGR